MDGEKPKRRQRATNKGGNIGALGGREGAVREWAGFKLKRPLRLGIGRKGNISWPERKGSRSQQGKKRKLNSDD